MPQAPGTQSKPVRLVIADVDGTLVTHEKILTQRAIQAVLKMREAGIHTVESPAAIGQTVLGVLGKSGAKSKPAKASKRTSAAKAKKQARKRK